MLGVHEELHVGPVPRGDDGGGVGVLGGGRAEVVAVADLLVVTVVDGGVGQDAVVVPPAKVLLEADCWRNRGKGSEEGGSECEISFDKY